MSDPPKTGGGDILSLLHGATHSDYPYCYCQSPIV